MPDSWWNGALGPGGFWRWRNIESKNCRTDVVSGRALTVVSSCENVRPRRRQLWYARASVVTKVPAHLTGIAGRAIDWRVLVPTGSLPELCDSRKGNCHRDDLKDSPQTRWACSCTQRSRRNNYG